MKTQLLYDLLSQVQPLTPEAIADFDVLLEEKFLKKNQLLTREGDRAHHCYFLVDGIIRVYYSKDGNEYNKTFFTPGSFPTPITALVTQNPCQLNFQALADCELLQFSYLQFTDLFEKHRCLESLMLKIIQREWINKERHDIHMVINDATTNYEIFRNDYPGLEQQIPQYHIASYLGITPIQLSRIRSQLLKTK